MKVTIDAKAFAAGLAIAGKVIPAKSPWPIMQNIRLAAEKDRLTMIGSDTDTTFEADVAAEVAEPGVAIVSFVNLQSFIGAAKGGQVTIEADSAQAVIKSGKGRITLHSSDPMEYPTYADQTGETFPIDRDGFLRALRHAAAAVVPSEARYNIAGVRSECIDDSLVLWGTDGKVAHRAALAGVANIGGGATIPLAAVTTILSVADRASEVRFGANERGWRIECGAQRAWGKVVDSAFPDMVRLMASLEPDWREAAVCDGADMAQAIAVAICGADQTAEKTRNLVLRADGDGPVVIRGMRPSASVLRAGRAEINGDVRGDFAVAVPAVNLTDALTGMGADTYGIEVGRNAVRLTPAQKSATLDLLAILTSIRATEEELADV